MSDSYVVDERGHVRVGVPTGALRLPPEVVELLASYGLQTNLGAALWRGYLLGAGLPKGDGQIIVRDAVYAPSEPKAQPEPG